METKKAYTVEITSIIKEDYVIHAKNPEEAEDIAYRQLQRDLDNRTVTVSQSMLNEAIVTQVYPITQFSFEVNHLNEYQIKRIEEKLEGFIKTHKLNAEPLSDGGIVNTEVYT